MLGNKRIMGANIQYYMSKHGIERMGGWRPGSPVLAAIYQNSIADQEEAQALEAVKAFSDRHKKKSC